MATGAAASGTAAISQRLAGDVELGLFVWLPHERPLERERLPANPCQGGRCERAPMTPSSPVPVRSCGADNQLLDVLAWLDARRDCASFHKDAEGPGAALSGFPYRIRRPPKV